MVQLVKASDNGMCSQVSSEINSLSLHYDAFSTVENWLDQECFKKKIKNAKEEGTKKEKERKMERNKEGRRGGVFKSRQKFFILTVWRLLQQSKTGKIWNILTKGKGCEEKKRKRKRRKEKEEKRLKKGKRKEKERKEERNEYVKREKREKGKQ